MKKVLIFFVLALACFVAVPSMARDEQQPDLIVEKMAVKFSRGLVNTLTCIVELPKQTVLTTREMGGGGLLVGPLKGLGMTLYRGFMGVVEAAFFLVPQPGYYDPLMDPPYVWDGWEPKRDTSKSIDEEK